MNTNLTETKQKIEEWIGNGALFLESMSDDRAEELLDWLEENDINIETDMDTVADFVARL